MFNRRTFGLFGTIALGALLASPAMAKCTITRTGTVDVIGNAFPVIDHIAKAMQACANSGLTVNVKVTDKARDAANLLLGERRQRGSGSWRGQTANGLT